MKVLLSILFLLVAFAAQSQSKARIFDDKLETKTNWISDNGIQNDISFESGILDDKDLNEFNGPDLFIESVAPNIQLPSYTTNAVLTVSGGRHSVLLQFLFIDLPPPSLS